MRLFDTMAMKRRKKTRVKKGRRPQPLPGMHMPPPMPQKQKKIKKKKFRFKKKIKLSLKSSSITESEDDYNASAGWTSSNSIQTLNVEDQINNEPQFIKHQCGLCGAVMQVPKPKRDKYSIICPHCEHEENFG